MPTMYTTLAAAMAALEINGGFIIEISVDREFWLAADTLRLSKFSPGLAEHANRLSLGL